MKINELLEILEPGDFILFDNESFISNLIKKFQQNSHIGIYNGTTELYHMTYPVATADYLKEYALGKIVTVMRFKSASQNQIKKMLESAEKDIENKRPYNVKGLIMGFPLFLFLKLIGINLVDIAYNDGSAMVCSSWAIEKAREGGVQAFAFVGEDTGTPDDILFSSDMFTILDRCKVELS